VNFLKGKDLLHQFLVKSRYMPLVVPHVHGIFQLFSYAQVGFSHLLRPGLLHEIRSFQKGLDLNFCKGLAIGVEFAQ
jgi:hypothetical protein